jgi:peptidoglycan/xylan/chitin deacetylase (PgdA/CDA1 family)
MRGNNLLMKTHIKKIYACFPEGKHKVLTMSYDDGKHDDRRLVDIFNKNGIRGTFNVNSGLEGDPKRIPQAEYRQLYEGHEVACHTVTHPTIARCPLTSVAREIIDDRIKLEEIMGYTVRGLAYPNGSYSDEICSMLPALGIRYGRVVGNTDDFAIPKDFLRWEATCHHDHNLLENGKRFLELKKKQYLYMMYVWGHSYEFSKNNNWDLIESFCEMMGGQDDIWYATNIEIVDYFDVVNMAQYAADGSFVHNPCAKSLWVCVEDDKFIEVKGGETVTL